MAGRRSNAHRTLLWCRPEQLGLASEIGRAASLAFVRAGTPTRGRARELAESLGAEPADDLRAALATTDETLVLLLDPGRFGATDDDASAVLSARARGAVIATLDPVPASALEFTQAWREGPVGARAVDAVRPVPLIRHTPAIVESEAHADALGSARSLAVQSYGAPEHGALGARLFGALDFVIANLGEPELIDATAVAPRTDAGLHALPGDSLRGLDGDLVATLRFADGRAAGLMCSNHAGAWARSITRLGAGGRLHADDAGFTWFDTAGAVADRHRVPPPEHEVSTAAGAVAHDLKRLLDPAEPDSAPTDHGLVLAVAQAALLSARTGQAECPATIRRLVVG